MPNQADCVFSNMPRSGAKWIFLLCVTLFIFRDTRSQQLVYSFRHFTTAEGLPSSEVHYILRDSENYMWFATDHGVCRYNGIEFEQMAAEDNSILRLYEDYRKRIWFISFSGRLFYFEKGKVKAYAFNDVIMKEASPIVINNFYVDSTDKIYIATTASNDYMSFTLDNKGKITRLSSFSQNAVLNIGSREKQLFSHFSEVFYKHKQGGDSLVPGESKSFIKMNQRGRELTIEHKGYSFGIKFRVLAGRDSALFLNLERTIYKFSPSGQVKKIYLNQSVLDIYLDSENTLWVGTWGGGAYELDTELNIRKQFLADKSISSVEEDYQGGKWFSTLNDGVYYLPSDQIRQLDFNGGILNKKINFLLPENASRRIWFGTNSSSFYYLEPGIRMEEFYSPQQGADITTICKMAEGSYLLGGFFPNQDAENLIRYRENGFRFDIAICKSGFIDAGNAWIGGQPTFLYKIDKGDARILRLHEQAFRVEKVFADSKGNLLIGSLTGLFRFEKGRYIPYASGSELLKTRVTDINEFKKKYLCIGTRGKGFLFETADSLYRVTSADGLTSDNIRKIHIEGNYIWLATNKGVSRLTVLSVDPFQYTIDNVTVSDGLASNEVNDILVRDDTAYFATNKGISVMEQGAFERTIALPVVFYIDKVSINNQNIPVDSAYDLSFSKRNFGISVVALNYKDPQMVNYRYRLLGLDDNWVYSGNREFQFNRMPFGKYTLQIEAKVRTGNWEKAATINVRINNPLPFWDRNGFWILLFAFVLSGIIWLAVQRVRSIQRKEKEKTEIARKIAGMEMQTLRAQMNPHFIFNALNSIQYFIMHHQPGEAQKYLIRFSRLVRMILESSRSVFITLKEEKELLDLYLTFEKLRFESRFDYEVSIDEDLPVEKMQVPNMIVQPLVENAVKHAFKGLGSGGMIRVSFNRLEGRFMKCTVADNGIGRVKSAVNREALDREHHSLGTRLISEKIESLQKNYNYPVTIEITDLFSDDGKPAGTKVELIFPIRESWGEGEAG